MAEETQPSVAHATLGATVTVLEKEERAVPGSLRLDVVVAPREGAFAADIAARLSASAHRFKLIVTGQDNAGRGKIELNGDATLVTASGLPLLERRGLMAPGRARSAVPLIVLIDPARPTDMLELPSHISGILVIDREFERLDDVVNLAKEGFTVLPRDMTVGVLQQRFRRLLLQDLSPVEHRVFVLIGEGRTNREIADELHISEMSVKSLVRAALRKLRFRNRTEAAVFASRLSVVQPAEEPDQVASLEIPHNRNVASS